MSTTPAAMWTAHDVIRLHRLIDEARRRLGDELPPVRVAALAATLRSLGVDARRRPASAAVGLFVSEHQAATVFLPLSVTDRVIIDPTFATRDLVRAAALRPRYRLLVLSRHSAALYEGCPGLLRKVCDQIFPITPPAHHTDGRRSGRGARFGGGDIKTADRQRFAATLKTVEKALVERHSIEPIPLVVAGIRRHLAQCAAMPDLGPLMAGSIRGNQDRTTSSDLDRLAAAALREHARTRTRDALAELAKARNTGRLAEGTHDTWLATVERRVQLLCVEERYAIPARVIAAGRALHPAPDPDHPEVLDDAIDELIEMVHLNGGRVLIVDDGLLESSGRIAAVTRHG